MEHPEIYSSLHAAENRELGERVAVVARVTELHNAVLYQGRTGYRARFFAHQRQRSFLSIPICDQEMADNCETALVQGDQVVVRGYFVAETGSKRDEPRDGDPIRFVVEDVSFEVPQTALLGATSSELAAADAIIDGLKGDDDLLVHVSGILYQELGMAHRTLSPRYLRAERLMVLQALSGGFDPGLQCNPRLSLYHTSSPGKGKKMLNLFGEALNPVAHLAQPALISPAGLGVHLEQTKGNGWRALPGAAPLCSGGILVIDDIHRLNKTQRNSLEGILMTVAEDGFVVSTKSSMGRYQAHCGIVLTGNPASTLAGFVGSKRGQSRGTADDRAMDLHMAMDLLSRIDIICNLDGPQNGTEAAREMASARSTARWGQRKTNPRIRAIQVLMSRVVDRFREVDFEEVEPLLAQAAEDLGVVLREFTARAGAGVEGESLKRRMSNTMRKLTAAIARMAGRGAALPRDVEQAKGLLSLKLEVVRWVAGDAPTIRPLLPWDELVSRAERLQALRQADIRKQCGGMTATVETLARLTGYNVEVLGEDLLMMGAPAHGQCHAVPTEEQYDEAMLRADEELRRADAEEAAAERAARAAAAERAAQGDAAVIAMSSALPEPAAPLSAAELGALRRAREAQDGERASEAPIAALPPKVPRDGIPRLPLAMRPYLSMWRHLSGNGESQMAVALCALALYENVDAWPQRSGVLYTRFPEEHQEVASRLHHKHLSPLLSHPDRDTRALVAFGVLTEAPWPDLEGVRDDIQSRLLRPAEPIPEHIRLHAESALRRLNQKLLRQSCERTNAIMAGTG